MSWFRSRGAPNGKQPFNRYNNAGSSSAPGDQPPGWTAATEQSHTLGLYNEATDEEFESAKRFCSIYPLEQPRLLSSDMVERIQIEGCRVWNIEVPRSSRFVGRVSAGGEKGKASVSKVVTEAKCESVCLLSNLPIMAGLYEIQGKSGVYYEVLVKKMDGIIAIGTACRPYPDWRFPGWNRGSVGLHLDDMRKFFEDSDGGMDYSPVLSHISRGDTIGCGYDFTSSAIFYTYNGMRLPAAFSGVYVPRTLQDVYAAVGVEGKCEFEVNFGAELFKWKEGNEWAWRVEGHVGRLSATSAGFSGGDELPAYHA
ncbi:hypothetical protein BDW22DRAFT_1403969 [Trametopsis cervina]|nr:hypothetical protein BDW22DRAFT_1403969 [Trametopsis cervina]